MIAPYVCDQFVKFDDGETFEDVKNVLIGGASVCDLDFDAIKKIFPNAKVTVGYGSSEADFLSLSDCAKPGSSGRVVPNTEIKVGARS